MKFPDIIIVGATKCGTTALWYNLNKHPDIYMAMSSSNSIEMRFWKGRKWKLGLEWYQKKFPDDKIGGEKTAGYSANPLVFKEMKKHIPNVKLILCVRNPVDRAYSNFQMNFRANKISGFDYPSFKKRYSNAGKYINQIRNNILKYFDKEQLYVCVAEHMKLDTTEEMRKIFEFIGVYDLNLPPKNINGILLRNRSRLEDIKLSNKEDFYRVWSKHTEKLTGPLRQELLRYYKPYNEKLFNYLGYTIKEWNK